MDVPNDTKQPKRRTASKKDTEERRLEEAEEDNLDKTENYLGALMKLSYKHLDGTNITKADMGYVLDHMPLTSDECESKVSHRILIEELRNQNANLMSADIQPKAVGAL